MHIELVIMFLSFISCVLLFFFVKGGFLIRFLKSYSLRIDEQFNEVETLNAQAKQMIDSLKNEISNAKLEEERLISKVTEEMKINLQKKVEEAKNVARSKMSLVDITLKEEKKVDLLRLERALKVSIYNSVSDSIMSPRKDSSFKLSNGSNIDFNGLSDSDTAEITDELRKRLH